MNDFNWRPNEPGWYSGEFVNEDTFVLDVVPKAVTVEPSCEFSDDWREVGQTYYVYLRPNEPVTPRDFVHCMEIN